MFKLINIYLSFLNLFIYFCLQNGVLYLPFIKEIPDLSNISPDELIYKGLQKNKIKTEISIGTEPQIIPMIIDLYHYDFFITGEKGNNNISSIIFKQSKSKTFNEFGTIGLFGDRGFSLGYKSSDYIYLNNDKEKRYNISFILAEDPDDGISGMIGLKLKENDEDEEIIEYNFIRQLKKVDAINNYYFTIKYVNDTFGFLIIGDLPEKYDKNHEHMEYRDTYIIEPDSPSSWNIKFDSIYTKYPNNSEINNLGKNYNAYFRIDLGITIGSEEYRKEFLNNFMSEQINEGKCVEKYISYYYVYYCYNTVDFSKMKNLYFYNKILNYSFEFTYKDLFYYNKLDNKYYFLIEFERNNYNGRWLIGEFFFKKYQLIFNQDTRKIGIYTENNNKKSNSKNNNWLNRNKWYLILIIFLFILLIVLAFLTYFVIKNKPSRKKKANELIDDDYDYTINNENEK